MSKLSQTASKLRRERGQAIIMFVGIFTVIMFIGAIVVDFGLWVSERRGAQKDADATSLAGVQAYLDDIANSSLSSADAMDARDGGAVWAELNQVVSGIDPGLTSDCSAGRSCINAAIADCREAGTDNMPWVEAKVRHESRSLFSSIFGMVAPDIGAIARACVGSPRSAIDLSPFGVQTSSDPAAGQPLSDCMEPDPNNPGQNRPVYGRVCILKTGSGDSVSGQRGALTIGNVNCSQASSDTLRHDFHYSTGAKCTVGNEVTTRTGNLVGLLDGLRDRLAEEGLCDRLYPTGHPRYDDFDEVFTLDGARPGDQITPSASNFFIENTGCRITVDPDPEGHRHTYQPRAINLVLIDRLQPGPEGSQTATITGFAAFYVIGCVDDDDAEATRDDIQQNLANMDPYLNRCEHPTGGDDILGVFVRSLAPSLDVGDPNSLLPLSIVLVK